MHKWRRTPRDLPDEQFEYIPLLDDVKQILRRANGNSREFIVETTYGSFEWRSFPIDHDPYGSFEWRSFPIDNEKVKEFIDTAPEEAAILPGRPPTVMLDRWVARERLIIDSDAEESDDINMTGKYNGGVYEQAEWYIAVCGVYLVTEGACKAKYKAMRERDA